MRAVIISLALALVSHPVLAQQPAAPGPGQVMKTLASSADVAALVAKAKSERKEGQALIAQPLLQLPPYNVSLEYRAAVANALAAAGTTGLIIPPNSVPVFSRLMRADKSAVSRVKLPRIATTSSRRFFNAASR